MLDPQEIEAIQKLSQENNGTCPECHGSIKFYRYAINAPAVIFLRAMADETKRTWNQSVDISTLGLPYSVRTQVTKLRLHALIARAKNADKEHEPNHWLITNRGWDLLRGRPVPKYTLVYNNQTLGHEGAITIREISADSRTDEPYEAEPATTAEARTYHDVREPRRHMKLNAVRMSGSNPRPESQEIEIDRLEVGKPIKLLAPFVYEYKDIAAFRRAWRVV